ncbi:MULTISPECIES: hypothetical protein [unclassified Akkermansia]|uniref:hypothetical protein n=3 Tax=Akkermansia TaxID=239934 RepID=UPI001021E33A|nr:MULTISPECIES: hypothetical protein [unclassified Akkermansia]KAA3161591.1 hypothetical protein F2A01_12925 [Akkermansia sp. BIOML-A60]KAA3163032.1 hypothetical protein F2A23_11480 [Akkermansia sp. BIOML-A63]KAA3173188.1 hypothetical protein F2A07_05265 [Akkermansia sp. BIOML-A61]KAA3191281.1 hypothetical protein F2A21_12325 [Akkermansia sp. BIOML-A54]KAA3220731.1 hypothetical protein F1985_11360 [Akkermansia sp. BIOML-A41]KAA3237885.1 hypothetical protein F1971_12630 [Akkermansia sp. BIOML
MFRGFTCKQFRAEAGFYCFSFFRDAFPESSGCHAIPDFGELEKPADENRVVFQDIAGRTAPRFLSFGPVVRSFYCLRVFFPAGENSRSVMLREGFSIAGGGAEMPGWGGCLQETRRVREIFRQKDSFSGVQLSF